MSFLSFPLPLKSSRWWLKDLSCLLLPLIKTKITSWLQMPSCGSFSLCIPTQPNFQLVSNLFEEPFLHWKYFFFSHSMYSSKSLFYFSIYIFLIFFSLLNLRGIIIKVCTQDKILHQFFFVSCCVSLGLSDCNRTWFLKQVWKDC